MEKEYIITTEQYEELKKHWKIKAESKAIYSADILIYNILRAKSVTNGFSPRMKNIQGNSSWYAFYLARQHALGYIRNPDMFKKMFGIDIPSGLKELILGAKHE